MPIEQNIYMQIKHYIYMATRMRTLISLIYLIHRWPGAEAFTTWTKNGEITKETAPLEFENTLSTGKRVLAYRQLGNFLDEHATVKLHSIRKSYFDIQAKCQSEGLQVFLPSNQDEVDDLHGLIPSVLREEDDGSITEDIYSGVYIRMSDMDYEGCWKTTGKNGAERPFTQMVDQLGG